RSTSEPLAEFVHAARSARPAPRGGVILLATVAYADEATRDRAVTSYSTALRSVGWAGEIEVVDVGALTSSSVARAAGLLVVGGDQSLLGEAAADADLARTLGQSIRQPG